MNKKLFSFAIALVAGIVAFGSVSAQQQPSASLAPAPTAPVMIKPKMKLIDLKNVSQFIQGVDLRGTEVDAYLDTRKVLTEAADAAAKGGKKDDDVIGVEMRLDQGQNLFTLMQRGQLKGAEAEKWREIVQSLQDAVKQAQDSMKK